MKRPAAFTCKAVLFDLDGTLLDSPRRILRLWQSWAERHGIPFEDVVNVIQGRRAVETLQLVAPHLHAEKEIRSLEDEELSDMHEMHRYPGALELLEALPAGQWGVVTSGSRRLAEARLEHMQVPRPGVLITGDDIDVGKPAPEGYLLAARRLKTAPADCVVVEDSPVGVEAGKAAGMRVIAVCSTHEAGSLQAADAIVSALTKLDLRSKDGGILIRLSH